MSGAEIAHRVRESVKRRSWKNDMRGWSAFDPGSASLVFSNAFLARTARRPDAPLAAQIVEGNRLLRESPAFLGQVWPPFPADQDIPWLLDPVSGRQWPGAEEYCFSVNHRHQPDMGDVKYVWELNRLQFLPGLALQERDSPAGTPSQVFALLESWMQVNPPFRGINWSSGIELALRIVAVTLASAILHDRMTPDQSRMVLRFLYAHAWWIHRFPSRFSSANNHLISEGLGMMVAGLAAPGLPGASQWRMEARTILEEEVRQQFHPDGTGAEQSPTYAAFSTEMVAFAMAMAGDYGAPLHPAVGERLHKAAHWLQTMLDDRSYAERIGDDDEGRVIAWHGFREDRYPSSVLACLARLLARPDLAPPVHLPHPRNLFFDVVAQETARSADGLHIFPEGGVSVYRGPLAGRTALVCLDHGPLGYLSIAAHGHADALSLTLRLDAHAVLADAGTYLYHAGREWRDAFRGTALHNTLMLDDVNQSRIAGAFMWSHKADSRLLESSNGPPVRLRASHDGYSKAFGVMHERSIEIDGDTILVTDTLPGNATTAVSRIGWLFHPDIVVEMQGNAFIASRDGEILLRLSGPDGFAAELVHGDEERRLGWYSPAFGQRLAAYQIIFTGNTPQTGALTRITVIKGKDAR